MPDESCRICGGELVKCSRCVECKRIIQKICRMCCTETGDGLHYECLKLQRNQPRNDMSITVLVANPRYNENGNHLNHLLPKILLVLGLVGILSVGAIGTHFFDFVQQYTDHGQITKSNPSSEILTSVNSKVSPLSHNPKILDYISFLGSANGDYLLIKCPAIYGYVYKTILNIPTGLISKFQSIFSLIGFNLIENGQAYAV